MTFGDSGDPGLSLPFATKAAGAGSNVSGECAMVLFVPGDESDSTAIAEQAMVVIFIDMIDYELEFFQIHVKKVSSDESGK